jgi:transposase InsO family protein
VSEQRYQAVLAVIGDGHTVTEVADRWSVSRQTLHGWLAKYEAGGLEGLGDVSHRPRSCPHQMPAETEVRVLEMRRLHPWWGPRRIRHELIKADVEPLPSESGVYRALVRAGLIDPDARRPRAQTWKRWERGHPMELWQMDLVGGFAIADDCHAKALSGVDDHSRFCVSAKLMPRERTLPVCDGLRAAMAAHGEPQQILTDNGKVFTGRFGHPPVEVLFDRICREHGIEHLLTKPRSPTTTGKIERFHRSLRAEFDTTQVFTSIKTAQQALDEWVTHYNHDRPHQSLDMATPAEKFYHRDNPTEPNDAAKTTTTATVTPRTVHPTEPRPAQPGQVWVSRRVASNGVVCVSWQQVCVGKHRAGARCDVLVTDQTLQFWIDNELLKTTTRTSTGEVRKKNASTQQTQA